MTSRDFCYWFQGYLEVSGTTNMDVTQLGIVRKHLNMVFKHEIDPSMGDQDHQHKLNLIHNNDPDNGLLRC